MVSSPREKKSGGERSGISEQGAKRTGGEPTGAAIRAIGARTFAE